MDRPVIGLNADLRSEQRHDRRFSVLCASYYDYLHAGGADPLIIPPVVDASFVARILNRIDGIVFVGGEDLDPIRDGWKRHATTQCMDARRDVFDRMLMRAVCLAEKPVLGIGVGMQLLNLALGGNLSLHIPEDFPRALPHSAPLDEPHRHAIRVVPGSFLYEIYGDGEVNVTSRHHMCIDDLATQLEAAARSADGIIEAVQCAHQAWPAFGTQFHPEHHDATRLDAGIFTYFVDRVRQHDCVLPNVGNLP